MPQDTHSSNQTSPSKPVNEHLRWRPDRFQLEILRSHFKETRYPSITEKHLILNELNKNSNTTIQLSQLNNWFQKRRMRESETKENRANNTRIYEKFTKSDLEYLTMAFEENMYPKIDEMVETAEFLGVKFNKVQNWYKQNRRLRAKEGELTLQERRYFDKDKLDYVQEKFNDNHLPSKKDLEEMAEYLQCDLGQVRNWFANNRKKLRIEQHANERFFSTEASTIKEEEMGGEPELQKLLKLEAYAESESQEVSLKASSGANDYYSYEEKLGFSKVHYPSDNGQYYTENMAPLLNPLQPRYYPPAYQLIAPVQANPQIAIRSTNIEISAPYVVYQNDPSSFVPSYQISYEPRQLPMKVVYVEAPYEAPYSTEKMNLLKPSNPNSLFYGNYVNNQYFSHFSQSMPLM